MATNEIRNGCESSIEAVLASNQKRRRVIKYGKGLISRGGSTFRKPARRAVIVAKVRTLTIPGTFLGVGYTKDRAGLPLESVRVPVPRPRADQVLIRVAASSLNPLEYKLAELNFLGRTPPVILGLDLSGIVVAKGSARNARYAK